MAAPGRQIKSRARRGCPPRAPVARSVTFASPLPLLPSVATLVLLLSQPASAATPVDFDTQIRPILAKNCFICHGPDEKHREAGLRLDVREAAIKPLEDGKTAIRPGRPDASELIRRITSIDQDERMPPGARTARSIREQIELLTRWVKEGARVPAALVVRATRTTAVAARDTGRRRHSQSNRSVHPRETRRGRAFLLAAGRSVRAHSPAEPRSPRIAAVTSRSRGVYRGQEPRRLRAAAGTHAGRSGVRRTLGSTLARSGPLCRHERLFRRSAADDLALPRLGDRRLQCGHALRSVHHRTACRRPASRCRAPSN